MTRLVVFGFDAAEAAQIRRIKSYLSSGFQVQGFTMRRDNMNSDFEPFWPNIHLYEVANESILRRIRAILGSVAKVARNREALRGADVIVARNLDMLAIAVAARWLTPGDRPPVIYECLDIHGLMTNPGPKGRLFRWLERRLLGQTASIIVSSPAFVSQYFKPVQGWNGSVTLLENKLWIDGRDLRRPAAASRDIAPDAPLVLGWVGTLRCPRSLELLLAAADAMGDRLRIEMHGVVHSHALPDFFDQIAARDNVEFLGSYDYPDGLAPIYGRCDLVWSQDLWQWGTNSTWLLPNRIYEASYFGCPSIAVDGCETGDRVAGGLGWTIADPTADALIALLQTLDRAEIEQKRLDLLSMPESAFRLTTDEVRTAIRAPLIAGDA